MIEIKNRKALYDYTITDTYEAGIFLTGTEIKSIREGKANLKDSYAIIKKGIISTNAVDKLGNEYEYHPVTKTKIKGFKIPMYDKVIKFVNDASEVVPEVGFVGWDISVTKDGPVMIEGNNLPAYDFYQSEIAIDDSKIGLKPKFDEAIFGVKNEKN